MRHALVVGASGLLGTNFVRHLQRTRDWRLTTLSRRPVAEFEPATHMALDLLDQAACESCAPRLSSITHVFFLARVVDSGYRIAVDPNLAVLRNLIDVLASSAQDLAHVQLMHGCKWYGVHLGPFRTPARETDPRPASENFYYGQHDYLAAKQAGQRWSWSTLRPHFIDGVGVGSPSNLVGAIGTYAAVQRELGQPLHFPGNEAAFNALLMHTHVDLLANAMEWAATEPRCANQDFNVANGDYFRWRDVWPKIAAHFAMPAGQPSALKLEQCMADKRPVWNSIVERHELKPVPFEMAADWAFADSVFRLDWEQAVSVVKAHQYGFSQMMDSEQALLALLAQYREQKLLP
ncbi:MAG: SDR family oxidoreductase [Hyphomicrobiaceae bacterium]|nr:SDR family oxidoreductase [Hyphomicrobiaceae bacterium]